MQDFDDLGQYPADDQVDLAQGEGQDRVAAADDAEAPVGENPLELKDPLQMGEVGAKKEVNRRNFKVERFIEDQNGIKALFKKFTMHPETVEGLRGTAGYEVQDLQKMMAHYQGWHLNHYPYYTFDHFAERIRKFGKTGPHKAGVEAYMAKLRRHYKGEELLEELNEAPKTVPEVQDTSYTLFKQMADQKGQANTYGAFDAKNSNSAANKPVAFNNIGSQQSFGLAEEEAARDPPEPKPAPAFDPNNLTEAQQKMIEEKRQIALSKKRKRQEMEAQKKLLEQMNQLDNEQIDEIDY